MLTGTAFTIHQVKDLKKSREFYEDILGLKPSESLGEHWQEYDLDDGSTFVLVKELDHTPEYYKKNSPVAAIAFEVDDMDKAIEKLKAQNIRFLDEPMSFPTCKLTVLSDPDGNIISLHQLDPARKAKYDEAKKEKLAV